MDHGHSSDSVQSAKKKQKKALALIVPSYQDKVKSKQYFHQLNQRRSTINEAKVLFIAFDAKYQFQKQSHNTGQQGTLTIVDAQNKRQYFSSIHNTNGVNINMVNTAKYSDQQFVKPIEKVPEEKIAERKSPYKKSNPKVFASLPNIVEKKISELSARLSDKYDNSINIMPDIIFLSEVPLYKNFDDFEGMQETANFHGIEYTRIFDPNKKIKRSEQKIIAYVKNTFSQNRLVTSELMTRSVKNSHKKENWVVIKVKHQSSLHEMKIAGVHLTSDYTKLSQSPEVSNEIKSFMAKNFVDMIIGDFNFPIENGKIGNRENAPFISQWNKHTNVKQIFSSGIVANSNAADSKFYMGAYLNSESVNYKISTKNNTGVLTLSRTIDVDQGKQEYFTDHNPVYVEIQTMHLEKK